MITIGGVRMIPNELFMESNTVHLCKSCSNFYPMCSDDEHKILFGDGNGKDNICCCNKYEPLLEHDYDRGGYK